MGGMLGFLQRLGRDRAGAIGILGALVLVSVIGVSALALEYGHALLEKSKNQRVADLAAYGGALVYNSSGDSTADAQSAATNITALNGVSGSGVTVTPSVVSSPTGDGNNAVEVAVTTHVPLLLARVLTTDTTMPVTASSYAEINANAPGCIIALSGSGTGITMDGGTQVNADNCAVASDNSVALSGGAKLVTQYVDYAKAAPSVSGGASITPPAGKTLHKNNVTTPDPLGGNSAVSTATAHIATVAGITSPSVSPGSGGKDVYFDYGGKKSTTASNLSTDGCPTATFNGSTNTWTVSCSSLVTFGNITLQGGLTVNFTTAGTYQFASSSATCSGASGYSICNTGTSLTFTGPDTFVLAGGVYNGGGASLALGSGSTANSYDIGKASDGNSLNAGTSKLMTLGDASGNGDIFQTAGTISTGGGSCLTIPAAVAHDINGNFNTAGGVVLGPGVYTVNGYVALGNSSGGDVGNCPTSGTTTGLTGLGVTLVISGASTVSCNGVASSAFCLGAGYSTVDLTAPTSGTTASLAVIGPQSSSNTAAAAFTTGATNTRISGAFYFPHGPVTMSGAAALADTVDAGACLELIGSQVTLGGGSAAASTCTGLGGGSAGGTTVSLVQ